MCEIFPIQNYEMINQKKSPRELKKNINVTRDSNAEQISQRMLKRKKKKNKENFTFM